MDPIIVALAGKAIAILRPYAAKTAQEFINTAGTVGYEKAKALLERLRTRWSGDAGSKVILENFEQQPEQFEPAMNAILQQQLAQDAELREEVARTVEELGPVVEIFQRMDEAENVTGLTADEVAGGRVSVTQDIGRGTGITGARLGRIG
jgi:hypothetical protein